ncbi:MAG: FHA domain-containing protein [Chloroflexota bacterium]
MESESAMLTMSDDSSSNDDHDDENSGEKTSFRVPPSIARLRRALQQSGEKPSKDARAKEELERLLRGHVPGSTRAIDEHHENAKPNWGTSELKGKQEMHLILPERDNLTLTFRLDEMSSVVIGRTDAQRGFVPDVDVIGLGYDNAGVSRRHAALVSDGNRVMVRDLTSTNGTYLNGKRVLPEQPRILRNGDNLRMGDVAIKIAFTG